MARAVSPELIEQTTRDAVMRAAGAAAFDADSSAPVFVRSAPARLDVLGGLAAEAGATVAQMALPRRAAVGVQSRSDGKLVIFSEAMVPPVGEPLFEFDVSTDTADAKRMGAQAVGPASWARPLIGAWCAAAQVLQRERPATTENLKRGATIAVHSDIAINAGQASSTACVTAAVLALLAWANHETQRPLQFEPLEMALLIHRAETMFAGASHGHVVDAFTCLSASDGPPAHVLRYSAQPHTLVGQAIVPGDLRLLAFDTGIRYGAAGETLRGLRLAAAMGLKIIETIYRDLGQRHTPLHGYVANVSPLLYRQYFRSLLPKRMRGSDFVRSYGAVPEKAGVIDGKAMYRVRTAVDHLIAEHEHAEQFMQAIEELTDPESEVSLVASPDKPRRTAVNDRLAMVLRRQVFHRAGRLLLASHHSYRLRLELSCREADWLVDHLMAAGPAKGVFGARITGCGGGGTVLALLDHSSDANDVLLDTLAAYPKITGLQLGIAEAGTRNSVGALLRN